MEIPNELVDRIVRSVGMPDLLNLCRSSRTLRDNSIKYMYRDVKLTFENADAFGAVIKEDHVLAGYVWSITLNRGRYRHHILDEEAEGDFYIGLRVTIQSLPNLHSLDVRRMDDFLGAGKKLIIPKLSTFVASEGPRIRNIINNHPQVTRLKLYADFDPLNRVNITETALPLLEEFSGSDCIARKVFPGSPKINKATIYWFEHGKLNSAGRLTDRLDDIYQILAGRDSLVYLRSIVTYWHPRILKFLAENVKNVVTLSFINISITPSDASTNDFLEKIEDCLGSFTSLSSLSVTLGGFPPACGVTGMDKEVNLLTRWSERCPTLKDCILTSRIVWTCVQPGVWVPNTRGTQAPPANQWMSQGANRRRIYRGIRSDGKLAGETKALAIDNEDLL